MAVLLREAIGGSLRRARTARRRTLRDVSRRARVSLGYLSEVERGRKEPSSELLAAICEALDVALPDLLTEAAEALAGRRPTRPRAGPSACATWTCGSPARTRRCSAAARGDAAGPGPPRGARRRLSRPHARRATRPARHRCSAVALAAAVASAPPRARSRGR